MSYYTPQNIDKDVEKGLSEVLQSTGKALYVMKTPDGKIINTVLKIDQLPRYQFPGSTDCINPSVIMGDIFAAISTIDQKICSLDEKISNLQKQNSSEKGIILQKDIADVKDRMSTLENNLRCLRRTITFEEETHSKLS